ncbi:fumarylacetoacetate hydrolase family protein [Desulfotruncus alcoholivorax]|uniref:fumarylacetoacetate hydrolase family protein n=1 Tax=Desulfotruncus alcoholivorax TaxID=265477 RepID=UPI0003FCC7E0|nr:fumarylacetoacetate hydrolase family protein [Desulfotruncus alcoholivorax]
MKLIRCEVGGKVFSGVLEGTGIREIGFDNDGEIIFFNRTFHQEDFLLKAPCQPTKIVAVGLNYREHAKESDMEVPQAPLLFFKPPSAVIGPGEDIILPPNSARVDYEAELAVVIKKTAKNVKAADYDKYVLGYTCFNDVSARDFQFSDGQWSRAKGYDTFAPMGPWIETELNPLNARVEAILDGKIVQSGNTSDFVFTVPQLIEYISSIMTLFPGDIIATGTPAGVGPMRDGQVIEIRIEGIGTLKNGIKLGK